MRRISIAAAVLALCAGPALAASDIMAGYYGNTVVSTGSGVEFHTHYRADHSFDLVGSMMGMSHTFKGTWALNGNGQICRTYVDETPPGSPNPSCRPIVARKVGETWTVTSDGDTRTITLKPGVQ